MTVKGWLQGALEAMDVGYGRRGKVVGKAVGERREVTPQANGEGQGCERSSNFIMA